MIEQSESPGRISKSSPLPYFGRFLYSAISSRSRRTSWGDFAILGTSENSILALRYDWRNNSVLFVHNLAGTPREVSFAVDAPGDPGTVLINLLSNDHSQARAGKHHLMLEAYAYRWYRVGGLDYLLKRSDIDTTTGSG